MGVCVRARMCSADVETSYYILQKTEFENSYIRYAKSADVCLFCFVYRSIREQTGFLSDSIVGQNIITDSVHAVRAEGRRGEFQSMADRTRSPTRKLAFRGQPAALRINMSRRLPIGYIR